MAGVNSPISSKNTVPPSAASKRPALSVLAPVNAPLLYPKSSLSINVSGIPAQLITTKGLSRLRLCLCMALATSSLPVPDSPEISMFVFVAATLMIRS